MKVRTVGCFVLLCLPQIGLGQVMEPGPKSPEESLRCIKPRPGFTVELMAAEPLVQSPIAFAWGPDGKFWVVEMGDYPLGVDGKGKPGGRIKFLTRSREDGPYDKATIFLDGLAFPTGVTPWMKGVLVTCAPDIFYAEDTDGDGKADKRTVLYTGFVEGNQQHRVNGLVYGLDNWFYGANGDSGGKIKSLVTGDIVDISGRDFRIRPLEGLIEAQSGPSQFGRARDDWGNWFGNNNTNPLYHYVLDDFYLKRNPHVLYPDPRVNVSEKPGAVPVFPISKPLPRFNSPKALNHFTSACSAIIYRDNLFGPEFAGNSFVSEPVHNLIHREIVKPKGVTFTSQRADDEQQSEFLASTDNWFRPTMLQTGPDGALWVADMYRYVIEHPQWIPLDWQKKLDLRAGHDKGRIYRIYPDNKTPRKVPRLDKMKVEELVKALDSPNGWERDMVQQLFFPRLSEYRVTEVLRKALLHSNPLVRLHAMCALDGPPFVSLKDLSRLRDDQSPGVQRHALRLTGRIDFLGDFVFTKVRGADASDPQVRVQLLYAAGQLEETNPGKALGYLLLTNGDDRYLLAAGLSSLHEKNWPGVLQAVLDSHAAPPHLLREILRLVPQLGQPKDMLRLLPLYIASRKDGNQFENFVHLAALLDTLEKARTPLADLCESGGDTLRRKLYPLREVFAAARSTVQDPKAPLGDKMVALRLLGQGFDQHKEDRLLLASLLVPQTPEDMQVGVIQILARLSDLHVPSHLLSAWKSYTPPLRLQVLDVLSTKADWTRAAIAALERKEILPSEVDLVHRQRFLEHKDARIRASASKLFAKISQPERNKVVEQYLLPILTAKGDVQAGAKLFAKHCAACHRLGDIGQQVGPDLASVADKTPEGLLTAILDPNRAVEARYVNYVATTKAGITLTGLLQVETSTSITLVGVDGKKHALLRKDLAELASTGKSVMPEGFEKDISPQDMADLIAFLRGNIIERRKETSP